MNQLSNIRGYYDLITAESYAKTFYKAMEAALSRKLLKVQCVKPRDAISIQLEPAGRMMRDSVLRKGRES